MKINLIFLILFSSIFAAYTNAQTHITPVETQAMSFINAFVGYYPTIDQSSGCPTESRIVQCSVNSTSDSYFIISINIINPVYPINTNVVPDYNILPISLPYTNNLIMRKMITFDNTRNPFTFLYLDNIPNLEITTYFNSSEPVFPQGYPIRPCLKLKIMKLHYTQVTSDPIKPYTYNFTTEKYPALTLITLGDHANGTLFIESPLITSIQVNSQKSNFVVTHKSQLTVGRATTFISDFVLNGLTGSISSSRVLLNRLVLEPALFSFDGLTTLKVDDYPNFYFAASNSSIPEFLFCNPKLNLTYIPAGYADYVNQSRMCGATISNTQYVLPQDSKITISGENLFFINSLLDPYTSQFNQIDHSDGLVEIEKYKQYEYTVKTNGRTNGTEKIIFSKFNGISFDIEWSSFKIDAINITQIQSGQILTIEGIFTINNISLYLDGNQLNILNIKDNLLSTTIDHPLSEGDHNVTLVSTQGNITNIVKVQWLYPNITSTSNNGLELSINGYFGENLNVSIVVNGTECPSKSSSNSLLVCTLASLEPNKTLTSSVTVDGFKRSFEHLTKCDCENPKGYCATNNLCGSSSTTTTTTTSTTSSDINSSNYLSATKTLIVLSFIITIFTLFV